MPNTVVASRNILVFAWLPKFKMAATQSPPNMKKIIFIYCDQL